MEQQEMREPILAPTFNGWSAHGDGWAVYGHTREEAIENYWNAEHRRREILAVSSRNKLVEEQSNVSIATPGEDKSNQSEEASSTYRDFDVLTRNEVTMH